ncbi:MAG: transposase [Oligoflexus sp.]|nr:transposase [Oligoflexus sp.]
MTASLPARVSGYFDSVLVSYIQHQYYNCRVTQPLLLEQLKEIGIDISSGQLNNILTENQDEFHCEKEGILHAGLAVSKYAQVDDTGARHKGKNGFSTCISNDLFTFFASSGSKSRINFLEILRAGQSDYVFNEDALTYMQEELLKKALVASLKDASNKYFPDKDAWLKHIDDLDITRPRDVRVVTEAALLASALSHGLPHDMVILSDDAGQLNVFIHALCWVHAERLINKLIGFNDDHRSALKVVRDQIWQLYAQLKLYKASPTQEIRTDIEESFRSIFTQKTCFETLSQALARLYKNKSELLRVLDYPMIPLHNNSCETDVREAVTKRKVSGGAQSDLGRRARNTFLSLKRTCRKLGVSFWKYLNDRNAAVGNIPNLAQLITEKAAARG